MANGYTRQKGSAAARTTKAKINCGAPKPHGNLRHSPNNVAPKGKAKGY
jgi:hypothetical protein